MDNLGQARALLREQHERYTNTISSKGMALSLETAALIWELCGDRSPGSIIDLGSGFSSFVVRQWAKDASYKPVVWSVDDDKNWLQRSKEYCGAQGVATSNFAYWDDFKETTMKFDLVL